MKKQVLFFILMLMPLMVSAQIEINGIYFFLNSTEKVAEVTSAPSHFSDYAGSIVIPETVNYEGVTFSVTSIRSNAFNGCNSLTSITIGNNVTSIGIFSFIGCSSLTSVTIGNSLTTIEDFAFYGCSSLTSLTIPNSVTSIGKYAFYGCSSLTSVAIGNNVTSIGDEAFSYCPELTSIVVENGNPVYDSRNNCNAIVKTSINELIAGCKSTIIPNSVTSIGDCAFLDCFGLTSVTIPNSVTSIGDYVFIGCSSLTSVAIGNSVNSIGDGVFSGCSSLTFVTIPNSVTSIGNSAFEGCSSLTSVAIGNSVNSIGDGVFSGCSGLTSVTIPNSVTTIGEQAFLGCSVLSSVSIGRGIKSIGTEAFAQCPKIKEVYCYAIDVPTISSDSFEDSDGIKWATLYVPETSVVFYKLSEWSQFGTISPFVVGILFADDAVETLCLANWDNKKDKLLSIKEATSVTDLGSVFANNTDITSFDELQYFTGLTSIGEQAFYYCSNLNSIIIPENVTTIGNRAFYVCSGLKSLRIPTKVSSVKDRAFAYCSGLETIEVEKKNPYYDSRNNCNALIQTSTNTLLVGCKNTEIPSSVKIIAEGAFRGCTELASIEIPEGVSTIGASAFRGCTGLTSVTLPSTITSIGNYAFSAVEEVYNLTSVTVRMTTPVAITSQVFPNRANSILYVPKGSRAAYKAANYWKEFKNIVEIDNGIPVKCEKPVITLLANGKIKVESATEGATCVTNITASNAEPLSDGEISLNTPLIVYTVTSYATKEGYDDSEVATATFRYEKAEGDINGDGNLNISDVVQLVNMILGQ